MTDPQALLAEQAAEVVGKLTAECRQCGKTPCMWCGGGFWYTSYSGGFAHEMPCDCCNPCGYARPKEIAANLPKDVVRALTEPGAAIPDSLWFGRWAFLREAVPGSGTLWRLSPLGLACRAILIERQGK